MQIDVMCVCINVNYLCVQCKGGEQGDECGVDGNGHKHTHTHVQAQPREAVACL